MNTTRSLLLVALIMSMNLSAQGLEKLKLVENGKLNTGLAHRGFEEADGYLQAGKGYFLKADRAISGDEITVRMKLSIGEAKGHLIVTVVGPSFASTISLGNVATFLKLDTPFELTISYKAQTLTYSIDGRTVFSEKAVVPPSGLINIGEWGANLRIYDISCEGRFLPIDQFYSKTYLLNRAEQRVAAAAERVKNDPNRPAFHFLPPANWNSDPNGMLYYDGYYHMFYQHNPYADVWDWMHWGHARSKNLVHWERLPIALWPSIEKGELHCFSGSGFIMDNGKPIVFYTSIGHEKPEQWAALPTDNELINWEKHPANPILTMKDHDGQQIDS